MTNKELQDALNGRLEKFGGEKYTGKEACTPVYHRWYMHEIESELESRGIEIFRAATWKIVAEIDGPGDLRVGYEPVASVNVEIKRDKRYKFGGPGVVKSIRVQFREDLQGLTIEETRAYLLKADLKNRLEYWRKSGNVSRRSSTRRRKRSPISRVFLSRRRTYENGGGTMGRYDQETAYRRSHHKAYLRVDRRTHK